MRRRRPANRTAVQRSTVTLPRRTAGGWGVDKTYYTTDGSVPTTASTVYSGPITLSTAGTYTVQSFSIDLAGNAESPVTQQITILAPKVVVSVTFDDGLANQYSLGYLRALQAAQHPRDVLRRQPGCTTSTRST